MHWKKSWMQTGHWPICCAGGEEEEFFEPQFPCLPLYIICMQKSDKDEQFRSLTKVHNLLTENQESCIITIWSRYALKERKWYFQAYNQLPSKLSPWPWPWHTGETANAATSPLSSSAYGKSAAHAMMDPSLSTTVYACNSCNSCTFRHSAQNSPCLSLV
jgi:hypothetical protein